MPNFSCQPAFGGLADPKTRRLAGQKISGEIKTPKPFHFLPARQNTLLIAKKEFLL